MSASFEDLLLQFLSPDDSVRKAAEAVINGLRGHHDELPLQLLRVRSSGVESIHV